LSTAEEVISNLLSFPSELDIVTEAVHSVSQTIDSRRFAEEFIRRRKMADKGLFEKPASPAGGASVGGWSEVAKKNTGAGAGVGGKQEGAAAGKDEFGSGSFKVVPNKKKGGKK
jgi:PERQ amino acid-rich with GYF domain-containing protein